jgi:hypothetical protein
MCVKTEISKEKQIKQQSLLPKSFESTSIALQLIQKITFIPFHQPRVNFHPVSTNAPLPSSNTTRRTLKVLSDEN